ncbi:MAG: hypothetical protein IIZ12_00155 [Eggerthellaceae bacterium]|nr:hypothetical protein [Eggerthellaceae bacterium]
MLPAGKLVDARAALAGGSDLPNGIGTIGKRLFGHCATQYGNSPASVRGLHLMQ